MDRRRPLATPEARRERLLEIFNSLPPEQQLQLIERLERTLAQRREQPPERARRPAPDVDGVKVPEPEEAPRRRPRKQD
jgi:hypothetical protein